MENKNNRRKWHWCYALCELFNKQKRLKGEYKTLREAKIVCEEAQWRNDDIAVTRYKKYEE